MFKKFLVISILGLLILGCGEKNQESNKTKEEKVLLKQEKKLEKAKPISMNDIQERNGIYYIPNSENPFTGNGISYHSNGQVKEKASFLEGKKHGECILYHDNGQIDETGTFVNGEGEVKYYDSHGKLLKITNFKDGKKHGLEQIYRFDSEKDQLHQEQHFVNGVKEGEVIDYYENGQMRTKFAYKNGLYQGEMLRYDEDGTLTYKWVYEQGKVIGRERF